MIRGVLLAVMLAAAAPMSSAAEYRIDGLRSEAGFDLAISRSRDVTGRFNNIEGRVYQRDDGHWQIELHLAADTAEIPGHPFYTRILRGRGFFDADHYPQVKFVSQPFDRERLRRGGRFEGDLTLRGITRREQLELQPAECANPMHGCALHVSGSLLRSRYKSDGFRSIASNQVNYRFSLLIGAD
ncbi:MAG: YceI family protein [Pseudomonadota bacterium]|nr:YceI family protein [Pseudomonadota bacterium]